MRPRDVRYRLGTMRRDRRRTAFYRRFVRPGDLAFDVGAHVGDRTHLLRRAGASVVAVEPHPGLQEKLRRRFAGDPGVVVVGSALGAEPGEAELRWPSGGLSVASMAGEWIERVRESGRFTVSWEEHTLVPVTTLDALIESHGLPAFCKIDVEGYEEQVLAGLSRALPSLSIEFTPEYLDSLERSLAHLTGLGDYRFDFSLGESLKLADRHWSSADELLATLREFDARIFGDVYARLAG